MNGQPVPSVTVVFTPVGSASAPNPGPYSTGVTDEQGNFTLQTRRDDGGAVPGPHRVGIEYGDTDELSEKFELSEADEESKPAIEKQIKELRALFKSRVKVPANVIYKFDVPKDGTSSADFELNQKIACRDFSAGRVEICSLDDKIVSPAKRQKRITKKVVVNLCLQRLKSGRYWT